MIAESVLQFLAACFGTIAFSVMFLVPREYYPSCGLIGGAGWMIYWWGAEGFGLPMFLAALAATAFVTAASRINAARKKCPATIFLFPVIFPLVPGIGIYRAIYYLIMDNPAVSGKYGRQAFSTAIAIVLGIMFAYEIPQKVINQVGKAKIRKRN